MRLIAALIVASFWALPALADYDAAARYNEVFRGVSMLVIIDGEVVFESYPNGGTADQANPIASGTKSFTGILAAAAVQDGLLDLDEPVAATLTGWAGTARQPITIRHLLNLTDGLERHGRPGRPPIYNNAIRFPVAHPVGEVFSYHSAPFQIFGEIMRRKLVDRSPVEYLNERVLTPYGIEISAWRDGRDGNPMMAAGVQITARNWARYGELILARGQLNGMPLVDAAAFAEMFEGSEVNPAYGLGFWLIMPIDPAYAAVTQPLTNGTDFWRFPDVFPEDMVMAAGIGHQRLYISPSRNMVVVRQAEGIAGALSGHSLSWSDVDFWRMLEAPAGEAPAEIVATLPAGLIEGGQGARPVAEREPSPSRPTRIHQPALANATFPSADDFVAPAARPAIGPTFGPAVGPTIGPASTPDVQGPALRLDPAPEVEQSSAPTSSLVQDLSVVPEEHLLLPLIDEEAAEEAPAEPAQDDAEEEQEFIGPTF